MATATSFATPNFSGMLFGKGQQATPFSTMIGIRPLVTNHVEFACGQFYNTETGEQPAISENASLTAPTAEIVTRQQLTNVTQIFQKSVAISYAKQSNMGTLQGINVAGQQANPMDELAFQVSRRMAKIAQDIEYTFINGVYNKATTDSEINKSRGILTAITTSILDMNGAPLTYWKVAEGIKCLHDQGVRTDNIVLGVDATTLLQLNYDAQNNHMTIVPGGRDINGLKLNVVLTPLGEVAVILLDSLPASTAILFDPSIMAPVYQPVPGKGNFFLEELSKVGAGAQYQIFGQVGLDHGPEWMSAKFTNISTALPSALQAAAEGVAVAAHTGDYTQQELEAMTVSQIEALATELGYTITGSNKADKIASFLTAQSEE